MAGHSLEEIFILNKCKTGISTIGNSSEIGEILDDLRLAPYYSWSSVEHYDKEGSV